jgi:tripartite-type tricarboxylate transporter receptor subunit TctC
MYPLSVMPRRPVAITFLTLLIMCAVSNHESERVSAVHTTRSQSFPTRPVRIVESFGVGGGPDLLARALSQQLSKLWVQTVTVENITGAGATAGPEHVATSPADGHTLLLNTSAQAYSVVIQASSATTR